MPIEVLDPVVSGCPVAQIAANVGVSDRRIRLAQTAADRHLGNYPISTPRELSAAHKRVRGLENEVAIE